MNLLSTQFLSTVLGLNEAEYKNGLLFHRDEFDSKVYRELNIYELAHLCKIWAKDNGFVIGTDLDRVNVWSIKDRCVVQDYEVYFEEYTAHTFIACQWIFDEQQKLKLRTQPTKGGD